MKFYFWVFCITFSYLQNVYADENIAYIYDGDTVKIHAETGDIKLRLSEIDAPEFNQPYGKKARRVLSKLCTKTAAIQVEISGTDRYDRQLGHLTCNGNDVAMYLVAHGYAWHYAYYSHNVDLASAQILAQVHHLGLWKNLDAVAPWIWRKNHPNYYSRHYIKYSIIDKS